MTTPECLLHRRRPICMMARISLTALTINMAISSVLFLITTYAFLLRSTKFELAPDPHSSNLGVYKSYLTRDGDFCVLPNAILGDDHAKISVQDDVTLVTQSSLHYLESALEQSRLWDGPISMSLYLPSWTLLKGAHVSLLALRLCASDFSRKVSVHFFYPSSKESEWPCPIQHLSPGLLLNFSQCQHSLESLLEKIVPRHPSVLQKTKSYPVNTARNIARRASVTFLTLLADIELMPSPNFAPMFMEFYKNRHTVRPKEAFVAPVFELELGRAFPRTKDGLHEEVRKDFALPFHSRRIAYECHRIPSLGKWWHSGSSNRSRMAIFNTTPWIRPCWEPVFLSLSSETPFYDERFRGYGKNKIQQVYEMCRTNFTFHILDNAFFVHRNISTLTESEWNEISSTVGHNNALYEKFKRELDSVYTNRTLKDYCDTNIGLGTPYVKRL